jgi:hypothetical protein
MKVGSIVLWRDAKFGHNGVVVHAYSVTLGCDGEVIGRWWGGDRHPVSGDF